MTADDAWKELASDSRQALALLGYPITPRCMPGEPEACGGTFAEHAWAQLHTLRAVTDHHLTHLPIVPPMSAKTALDIYLGVLNDLHHRGECR